MALRWKGMDEGNVVEVVERASRSVVNINTLRVFRDVFYRVVPVKGMGSGFIIDGRGYVLTNSHVITKAERIAVTLTDGRVFEGRLMGTCRSEDIAVVKIDGDKLASAELGDSDKLKVGQRVFAIGNPFGLVGGPTVTSGVVSALNRTVHSKEGVFKDLVQTDAAINPGNSGGPLIDGEGRVVAINTAIIPFAQGIGFAIPINTAKTCSKEILLHGESRRPWLGITGLTVTKQVANQYGFPVERGVLVAGVESDSPADKAGIEQGDIILEFDDRRVNRVEDLQSILREREPGDRAGLTVLRGSRKGRLEAVLERTP
ncbi:MAG: trypsin-like peptidase domain-containing protein [Candidatus Bathyarchaeota archaeon]|nr:trypsin-like peptidase domain-containing protein [Candidatus Bathyarchaeota archaeon]